MKGYGSAPEYFKLQALFKLFLAGFFLVFVGMVFLVVATFLQKGTVGFGGMIFVGPFPIVIGLGSNYLLAVILAIFLAIVMIVLFLLLRRKV